jgi:hypothetical protein
MTNDIEIFEAVCDECGKRGQCIDVRLNDSAVGAHLCAECLRELAGIMTHIGEP